MVIKKFDKYIKESQNNSYLSGDDIPECLIEILDFIKNQNINTTKSKDGRVGSIKDEDDCLDLLKGSDIFDVRNGTEYEDRKPINKEKISILIPKVREWYDMLVIDKNGNKYYVNIKSSSLKTPDNIGSLSSILYGMFGIISKETKKAKQYSELFFHYNKHKDNDDFDNFKNIDYYYLIINKNITNKSFFTSLNHFTKESLRSNGSNLPFQCNWSYNSIKVENKKKVCDIIMSTIYDSLLKTVEIFNEKPIKVYTDRYRSNEKNNINNLF